MQSCRLQLYKMAPLISENALLSQLERIRRCRRDIHEALCDIFLKVLWSFLRKEHP